MNFELWGYLFLSAIALIIVIGTILDKNTNFKIKTLIVLISITFILISLLINTSILTINVFVYLFITFVYAICIALISYKTSSKII